MNSQYIELKETETEYLLFIHYSQKERAKKIEGRQWDQSRKCWVYPKNRSVYDALIAEFGDKLNHTVVKSEPIEAQTNVASNFFETVLSKDQIIVPYLSFENKENLNELIKSNPNTIFMHYWDKIFFWGNNSISTKESQKIDKDKDCNLFSNILAYSLLKSFYQNVNVKINKKFHIYKIIFMDNDLSNNKYQGLKLYKTFHLHFTPIYKNSHLIIGFTISTSITEKIFWTIEDFKTAGIQYDDLLCIKETGQIFVNAKSKYRLAHHFNYASQLKNELDKQSTIQNEFREINMFVETYFKKNIYNFVLPDDLQLLSFNKMIFSLDNQQDNIKSKILPKPECYFYNGIYPNFNNTFNNRQKIGYNKPFTFDEFENREINISLIYPKNFHRDVDNFFKKNISEELFNIFKLNKDRFRYKEFEIDNFELVSYQKILSSIRDCDLVIVVIDEAHEVLKPKESPYYFCKSEFIRRGINTQEIQIQQIQKFLFDKNNKILNYTDHNIALNIYAKLGGMAWTIKPNKFQNELIFGIGATTDKDGQPVLGLTSIFRGDGKYLFGRISSVTDMKNYEECLEQIISETIINIIKNGILNTEKVFYLIFHIFKPAGKDNEIKALERVIDKFSNYSFEHAFIHIGNGHNYRFFTYKNVEQGTQLITEGNFIPNRRGTLIEINNRMEFLGLQTNNSVFYKIDIHKKSSFIDLEYIAEQIYQFSEMSHKGYKQGEPVTIKYPSLMAYFAEKFKDGNLIYLSEITMPDNSLWFI